MPASAKETKIVRSQTKQGQIQKSLTKMKDKRKFSISSTHAGGDAPDKKESKAVATSSRSKVKELPPPEPEEIVKTPSQIAQEEAEYRAFLRRQRFKRKWPEVTKARLRTVPWTPPLPPQRPPPVIIDRPELKTRRWVPPYMRRRRMRMKRLRIPPEEISQPLPIPEASKLRKIWHNFTQVDRNKMILQGTLACNSKKYSSSACGSQTACIAVVCRALLDEKSPGQLTGQDVDELIRAGDSYYKQCMKALKCYKGKPQLELNQLLPYFYLHDTKYTIKMEPSDQGVLAKHPDRVEAEVDLMGLMENRIGTEYKMILSVAGTKHFLIWGAPPDPDSGSQVKTVCYIFDPHMLNEFGQVDPHGGYGAFIRYPGVSSFVVDFLLNHADWDAYKKGTAIPSITLTNIEIVQKEPLIREPTYTLDLKTISPHCRQEWQTLNVNVLIEKKMKEGLNALGSLSAISLATSRSRSRKKLKEFYQKAPLEPPPQLPLPPERPPPPPTQEQIMALRGENFFLYCPTTDAHTFGRDDLIPLPKSETLLHSPVEIANQNFPTQYRQLDVEKWILRGTRHFASQRYQTFKSYTGIPCCVAAIAMLKRFRARAWNEDTLDETLDIGYNLYRESLVERGGPIRRLVLGELKDTFRIRDREYKHKSRNIAVWGKLISSDPKIFDLCRGIEHFFKEADSGILQIPGEYEVAIWNEGGKFYVYHPWPADRYGSRVGLYDGGKACIFYFTRVSRLCDHFMDNVMDLRRKPFSISDVLVLERKENLPEPVNSMKPVAPNRWIVRGSFHEGDARFPEEHRGRQATPTAITALAMSHVLDPADWTAKDVDEVLIRGDVLYQSTVETLEKMGISLDSPKTLEEAVEEEEQSVTGTLAAADVLNRFKVSDYDCIETDVMDSTFNGSLNAQPPEGVLNLKEGLTQFFKDNTHGVFTARGRSTAIWKQDDHFYFYDPHGCDENGLPSDEPLSSACLIRVKGNVKELSDVLLSSLPPGTDDSFNLSPVSVTATKLNVEIGAPETKLESKEFQWISKGTAAIMMGCRGENSAIGKAADRCGIKEEDTAGRTLALPAAAAFTAASVSVPPPHMHHDHMYNLLDAGADYYMNHLKKTGRRDIEVEDLTEKFEMGANTFAIELGEPVRLPLRLPDVPAPEGEEAGVDDVGVEGEEEEKGEQLKQMKDLLFKMWYDFTQPTTVSLLVGDYHQLGVWMTPGGKIVAFDPAPTVDKGRLTSHRIKKGDELRLQRLKEETVDEGADEEDEEDDEEVGGEGEEKPEPEAEPVPPDSCPALIVAASPGEFIDKLTLQGGLTNQQAIAPYKLYPVTVTNELTSLLKEKRGDVKPRGEDENEAEEDSLIPALDDSAIGSHFTRVSRGIASVRGQVAQNENYFQELPNRDNQDAANAVMGIVVDHIEPYIHWKPELIDGILKYGDRLYTMSLSNAVAPPWLHPEEVVAEFHVTNFNVKLEIEGDVIHGDIKAGDSGGVLNLKRGLKRFFETHNHGVLCSKNYCVGIWKGSDGKSYLLWEPHAVGPVGKTSTAGAAAAVLFSTIEELAEVFRWNVEGLMRPGNNNFSISAIKVFWEFAKTTGPVTPQGAIPDEGYEWKVLTAYVEIARGRTILRGSRPDDVMKFTRDSVLQSSCGAIIAGAMSKLRRAHLWTRRTVDEVTLLAGELFNKSLGSLGYEFRPEEDILMPLQVAKRFILGVNYVRYDLEEVFSGKLEQKEPSEMTVRCALERFFESNTLGILWSPPHAVAVWRAPGAPSYYMAEPHACGPRGLRIDGSSDCAPCVLTFTSPKLMAFAYLQNYPLVDRPKHEFHLYAMSVAIAPIRHAGAPAHGAPLIRPPPGMSPERAARLVPATSKVGVDGSIRHADESIRKHPPGSVTCLDAQRATELADKDQVKLKGQRNSSGWLVLNDGTKFMSAQHSMACRKFNAASRGKQGLTCAIMAVAMSRVEDVCRWCTNHLDEVLDSGDQLYQDSYLHFRPKSRVLGVEQVLRKFYAPGNCVCRVLVYKSRQHGSVDTDLFEKLLEFFREERCGVFVANGGTFAVALFRTPRGFYMFDPADRDRYGRAVAPPCTGRARACLSYYPTVKSLAEKLGPNIPPMIIEQSEDRKSKQDVAENVKDKDTIKEERISIKEEEGSPDRANREIKFEEPATFDIYGMDVTALRRLNKHER